MNEETTQLGVSGADESLASALGGALQNDAPSPREQTPPEPAEAEAGAEQSQADAGEGDPAAASITTLEQLAEQLGSSVDDILDLHTKAKIDGEEKDATLRDILKSYQLEGHVNRKSIELSEKQKAFETEQSQVRNEWGQRVQFTAQVLDSQEAQLAQQFHSVNWQALQTQDPAQYSALYLQFQQAGQQLQAQKAQLAQHYQQTQAQLRQQLQPKAMQAIRESHPDLADPVSYGNALSDMKAYLKGIGAPESNFDALELDPVVFTVARDAARYRAIVAKRPDVTQKVAAAPKFEKSSMRESGNPRGKALKDRAMRGDEDAMAAILAS